MRDTEKGKTPVENYTVTLTEHDLMTIRSCLTHVQRKEDAAVARGEHVGVRLAYIRDLLKKLPELH